MTPEHVTALLQLGQGLTVTGLLVVALYTGSRGTWVFGTTYRQQNAELHQQIGKLELRIELLEKQHDKETGEWSAKLDALTKENVQLAADLRVAQIEVATLRARVVAGAGTA